MGKDKKTDKDQKADPMFDRMVAAAQRTAAEKQAEALAEFERKYEVK